MEKPDDRKIELVPLFVVVIGLLALFLFFVASVIAACMGNIAFALSVGVPSLFGLVVIAIQVKAIKKMIERHEKWMSEHE